MTPTTARLNHVRLAGCARHDFREVSEAERRGPDDAYRCARCHGFASAGGVRAYLNGIRAGKALDPDAPVDADELLDEHYETRPNAAKAQFFLRGVRLGQSLAGRDGGGAP
jgi:hypothetical protein